MSVGHPIHRMPPLIDIPSTLNDASIDSPSLLQFDNTISANSVSDVNIICFIIINCIRF